MGLFDCGIPSGGFAALECQGCKGKEKDLDEISDFYSFAQEMDADDANNGTAVSGLYSFAQDDYQRPHATAISVIEDDLDAAVAAFDFDLNPDRSAMYYKHEQEIEQKLKQFLHVGKNATSVMASVDKAAEKMRSDPTSSLSSRRRRKKEAQQPAYIRIFCKLQEHSSFVVFCFERKAKDFTRLLDAIGLKLLGKESPDGTLYLMCSSNEFIEVSDIITIRDEDKFVFVPFEPGGFAEVEPPIEDLDQSLQGERYVSDYSMMNEEYHMAVLEEAVGGKGRRQAVVSPVSSLPWDEAASEVALCDDYTRTPRSARFARAAANSSMRQEWMEDPSERSPTSVIEDYQDHDWQHEQEKRREYESMHDTRDSSSVYDTTHSKPRRRDKKGSRSKQRHEMRNPRIGEDDNYESTRRQRKSKPKNQAREVEEVTEDYEFERKERRSNSRNQTSKMRNQHLKQVGRYQLETGSTKSKSKGRSYETRNCPLEADDYEIEARERMTRSRNNSADLREPTIEEEPWDDLEVSREDSLDLNQESAVYQGDDIREEWRGKVSSTPRDYGRSGPKKHDHQRRHRDPSADKYCDDGQYYSEKKYSSNGAIAAAYYAGRIGIDPFEEVDYALQYENSQKERAAHEARRERRQERHQRKIKQN